MAKQRAEKQRALTLTLFAVYMLILIWMVLFKLQFSVPVIEEERTFNLIPLQGSYGDNGLFRFGEVRNNILAFIPLGIYLCMLKRNWLFMKKTLSVFLLSMSFEVTQFVFAIGIGDITDVLSNTLGGIAGMGIYSLLFLFMKNKTDKAVNTLAAVCTILVILLVVILLANHRWVRFR